MDRHTRRFTSSFISVIAIARFKANRETQPKKVCHNGESEILIFVKLHLTKKRKHEERDIFINIYRINQPTEWIGIPVTLNTGQSSKLRKYDCHHTFLNEREIQPKKTSHESESANCIFCKAESHKEKKARRERHLYKHILNEPRF